MRILTVFLAMFLAAGAAAMHGAPVIPGPSPDFHDDPNMSLEDEIAAERAADLAAADLAGVWLDPADFPEF